MVDLYYVWHCPDSAAKVEVNKVCEALPLKADEWFEDKAQ